MIIVGIGSSYYFRNNVEISNDLLMDNVEALANGESGTPVDICLMDDNFVESESSPSRYLVCNDKTSANMIYPCPSEYKQGVEISGGRRNCTK